MNYGVLIIKITIAIALRLNTQLHKLFLIARGKCDELCSPIFYLRYIEKLRDRGS